jgi:hypothetical protein
VEELEGSCRLLISLPTLCWSKDQWEGWLPASLPLVLLAFFPGGGWEGTIGK